jgi:hypothetical protein
MMIKRAVICISILGLWLSLASVSISGEEEEFEVPVEFTSIEMEDLGDFHGTPASSEQSGWLYAGSREPIVSPGWVVFPVTGVYRFEVECKSQQFEPDDPVFAEFDVRLHILGERNNSGMIDELIETVADTGGDMVVAHGSCITDDRMGEPWEKVIVSTEDPVTHEPMEIEKDTKAQVEIWFTNDKWADPLDRNLMVRAVAVLLPEGVKIAVEPISRLPAAWGKLKAQ